MRPKDEGDSVMESAHMITVKEIYLKSDPGSGNMVILKEKADSGRFFMMFIGDAEFAAIAKEKGLVESKRPLTHEVYLSVLDELQVEFLRIEIYAVKEDTYYANVIFQTNGTEHTVDSRPSDALALALNRKTPILVSQELFRRELTREEIKEYEGIVKTVKF
jgi:bifunctional DNase/RNase